MTKPVRLTFSTTQPFQLIDLSDKVAEAVAAAALADGLAHVFCPHTSCGLVITEAENGLHEDFERALDRLAPTDGDYAHDDMSRRFQNIEPDERRNGWSHIRGLLATQPAVTIPILDGGLGLGQWQRVFLVELDGPRPARTVVVQGWGNDPAAS